MPAAALLAALLLAQADAGPAKVSVNGYLSERVALQAGWSASDPTAPGLAQLAGLPLVTSLTEANAQLRIRLADGWDVFTDLSFFVGARSEAGGLMKVPSSHSNRAELSEFYLNLGFHEHLNGLVGRKRVVWGSGFAWNPADLLNPPKDPTDPTLQRAGAWMARIEAPFQYFTLSALWAPKVVRTSAGLPSRFLFEPGGHEPEQILGARAYALIKEADVNLMWFWSNRYADTLPHSHRFAASFSRYFFTDYEFHFEGVLQRGRDTPIVDPRCLPRGFSFQPLLDCQASGQPVVAKAGLSDPAAFYAQFIAGTRYSFKDESMLSAEYYFNGPGLDAKQWEDRQRLLGLAPTIWQGAQAQGIALDPSALLGGGGGGSGDQGSPLRLDFRPLRRHYLFLVYQKPRIADDFTATVTTVVGLEDPSLLLAPSLSWSAREWLSLGLFAYLPLGASESEYGSLPFRFRALLEVRAFY
ncbi:MAG TPA: hypothetical protein VGK67_33005 [Myxococcales bacterium]|jgi:hypothetical protein